MSDVFIKAPWYQSAKYLNDVNDAQLHGALTGMPSAVGASQYQQNQPGDRILLDDATALALSDTAVGTLYGGIYMYVLAAGTSTAAPTRGCVAFFALTSVGSATSYTVTPDAQPLTTVPTMVCGIYISAITKGNYGWIQVSGIASVLYDSSVTANVTGNWVSAKVSASVAGTVDVGAVVGVITIGAQLGVSIETITTSTVSRIAMTRGFGRI